MVGFTYPKELVSEIEKAKSLPKKIISVFYILMRLCALLFILLFIILGCVFLLSAFMSNETGIAALFSIFFFALGAIGLFTLNRGGVFDSVRQIELSPAGLVMKGDFGVKWERKPADINEVVVMEGSNRQEEMLARRFGLAAFFATYITTLGKSATKVVIETPILYLPKEEMPHLHSIVSSWKKKLVPLNEYSPEKTIEKDDARALETFIKLAPNETQKKIREEMEKEAKENEKA